MIGGRNRITSPKHLSVSLTFDPEGASVQVVVGETAEHVPELISDQRT